MNDKLNILLAEDDDSLGLLLQTFLKNKGHYVSLARTGKIAYDKFNGNKLSFDFIIMDVMMPEMDGFTLTKEIREIDKKIPILFLTAKALQEDVLQGFELGADDYLTKPFSMEELLARIQAIYKRSLAKKPETGGLLTIGNLKYEPELSVLHLSKETKKLTTKENNLLLLLVKNQGDILDRQATLRAIWGDDNYFNGRSMDVYIAKLRKLLKEDDRIEIMNIHGIGFKLLVKS